MNKIVIAIIAMSSMTLCAQQTKTLTGSIDNRPPVITIKMSSEELSKIDAAQNRYDIAQVELHDSRENLKSIKYNIQQSYNPNNNTNPSVFYTCGDVTYSEGVFNRGYIIYQLDTKIDCLGPPHAVYADATGNLYYNNISNDSDFFDFVPLPKH